MMLTISLVMSSLHSVPVAAKVTHKRIIVHIQCMTVCHMLYCVPSSQGDVAGLVLELCTTMYV
jgi:hypothetical protein